MRMHNYSLECSSIFHDLEESVREHMKIVVKESQVMSIIINCNKDRRRGTAKESCNNPERMFQVKSLMKWNESMNGNVFGFYLQAASFEDFSR